MIYILYNPHAGNHHGEQRARQLDGCYPKQDLTYVDMTKISDYSAFLEEVAAEDELILCGGDGTLNRFVNDTEGLEIRREIRYYPVGSGNDFAHDLGIQEAKEPFIISPYLKNLPLVAVNGKQYRFLNGIGYGIDGYCCEVGDNLRKKNDKPINYTSIAIQGLLFHYKPTKAKVTVDGVCHTYDKVWLSPTMYGRFYGGGMIPTPQQNRLQPQTLSVMVLHGSGKLKTLAVFPSIFKGKHVEHREMVDVLRGSKIIVEFDRPTALQIDGETILNVTSYQASLAACVVEKGK